MIYKTYLNKVNTILENSELNVGVSPVAELVYGHNVSRIILEFPIDKIKKLYDEKSLPDLTKCKHYLNLTNCGALDRDGYLNIGHINNITNEMTKRRAASFDLIFFTLPYDFDAGNGYDFLPNLNGTSAISYNGATWYKCKDGSYWPEAGVYDNMTLAKEYDKYSSEGSSIIVSRQHFDTGNENIHADITEFVNAVLLGETECYGLGIAFSPLLEVTPIQDDEIRFVSFFTNHTNTFFEPYLETVYDDAIVDDRNNFYLDKDNKLYLYCNVGETLQNLDEMPVCKIGDTEYLVKQATKGVYYIDINLPSSSYKAKTMLYDVWSNLKHNGISLPDVTLDFVLKGSEMYFNFNKSIKTSTKYIPQVFGFKDSEIIQRGDIRKINIVAREPYTTNKFAVVDNMEIRLYVIDGNGEMDVIPYDKVNRTFSENYYLIDTSTLIPNRYYVDVRMKYDQEEIVHHKLVHFDIVNNLTEKYKI